jgi:hypothetical protein
VVSPEHQELCPVLQVMQCALIRGSSLSPLLSARRSAGRLTPDPLTPEAAPHSAPLRWETEQRDTEIERGGRDTATCIDTGGEGGGFFNVGNGGGRKGKEGKKTKVEIL